MKNYFKIMLDPGKRIEYAEECLMKEFIGADYGVRFDLTSYLSGNYNEFNNKFIHSYLKEYPGKKRDAELVGEKLWSLCNEIRIGDIIVCPNGRGTLYFGEVTGDYFFKRESILPHTRSVKWFPATCKRANISKEMRESLKSKRSSLIITRHADEIEKYIREYIPPTLVPTSEKHLENFLLDNWKQTELGIKYDIYEEDGEFVGQQYPSDTGPIDILAVSKDKTELLVVELKKGKASDVVVGQIQRYMGFVQNKLANKNQLVKGIIIASEDDKRIRSALLATKNIEFLRYHINITFTRDKTV